MQADEANHGGRWDDHEHDKTVAEWLEAQYEDEESQLRVELARMRNAAVIDSVKRYRFTVFGGYGIVLGLDLNRDPSMQP